MPVFGPIKRQDLIRALRRLGFDGSYTGGSHQYMVREKHKLYIPNPHSGEISPALLARILQQAGIDRSEWEQV